MLPLALSIGVPPQSGVATVCPWMYQSAFSGSGSSPPPWDVP